MVENGGSGERIAEFRHFDRGRHAPVLCLTRGLSRSLDAASRRDRMTDRPITAKVRCHCLVAAQAQLLLGAGTVVGLGMQLLVVAIVQRVVDAVLAPVVDQAVAGNLEQPRTKTRPALLLGGATTSSCMPRPTTAPAPSSN